MYKWVSINLVSLSNYDFFVIHYSRNSNGAKKKIVWNFSAFSQEKFSERKTNSMVQGFHLSCLPYRITIFLAFIILEILTGHKQKKQYVIFLHVHRKNLVKEKKIIVVQKCVSITFPVQFSSGQSFSFPGRATDTAVPTGQMTLGTLEK